MNLDVRMLEMSVGVESRCSAGAVWPTQLQNLRNSRAPSQGHPVESKNHVRTFESFAELVSDLSQFLFGVTSTVSLFVEYNV